MKQYDDSEVTYHNEACTIYMRENGTIVLTPDKTGLDPRRMVLMLDAVTRCVKAQGLFSGDPRAAMKTAMQPELMPGDQVAYIPAHAATIFDEGVEFGFITSIRGNNAFCRFWRKDDQGLRTTANSERVRLDQLRLHTYTTPERVQQELQRIKENCWQRLDIHSHDIVTLVAALGFWRENGTTGPDEDWAGVDALKDRLYQMMVGPKYHEG